MKCCLKRLLAKYLVALSVTVMVLVSMPVPSLAKEFPDVPRGHWAYSVIQRAVELNMMKGYENGEFGPEDPVTRGQIAVVLWNMEGKPLVAKGKNFSDVKKDAYYYNAVRWASLNGVVSGYKNTNRFGPNDKVTREQLAVMLCNYASKVAGMDTQTECHWQDPMLDSRKVSGYAKNAISWCVARGIITGSKGKVNPQGNTTRAEAAKMLVYLYDTVFGTPHDPKVVPIPREYVGTYSIHWVAGPIPEDVGGRDYPEGTLVKEQTLTIKSIDANNQVTFEFISWDALETPHPISTGTVKGVAAQGSVQFSYEGISGGNDNPSGETGIGLLTFESGKVIVNVQANTTAQGYSCDTDGPVEFSKGVKEITV